MRDRGVRSAEPNGKGGSGVPRGTATKKPGDVTENEKGRTSDRKNVKRNEKGALRLSNCAARNRGGCVEVSNRYYAGNYPPGRTVGAQTRERRVRRCGAKGQGKPTMQTWPPLKALFGFGGGKGACPRGPLPVGEKSKQLKVVVNLGGVGNAVRRDRGG